MNSSRIQFPLIVLILSFGLGGCRNQNNGGDSADLGGCPALCHDLMDAAIAVWDDIGAEGDPIEIVEPYRSVCDDAPAVDTCVSCATYINDHIPYINDWELQPDLLGYYGPEDGSYLDSEQIADVQASCEDRGLEF